MEEENENISLLQESIVFLCIFPIELKDLEEEDKIKDREIAKLNKAILKGKSKKDIQSLVDEIISYFAV